MKKLIVILLLTICASSFIIGQSRIFTISNSPSINVTPFTPFQPIDPTIDANLNILDLVTSLGNGDAEVNESFFFPFEIAVIDDLIYLSPFNLTRTIQGTAIISASSYGCWLRINSPSARYSLLRGVFWRQARPMLRLTPSSLKGRVRAWVPLRIRASNAISGNRDVQNKRFYFSYFHINSRV